MVVRIPAQLHREEQNIVSRLAALAILLVEVVDLLVVLVVRLEVHANLLLVQGSRVTIFRQVTALTVTNADTSTFTVDPSFLHLPLLLHPQ